MNARTDLRRMIMSMEGDILKALEPSGCKEFNLEDIINDRPPPFIPLRQFSFFDILPEAEIPYYIIGRFYDSEEQVYYSLVGLDENGFKELLKRTMREKLEYIHFEALDCILESIDDMFKDIPKK